MSMISELVKELRNEAQEVRLCSNECESAELLDRAADTIEMLSEKAREPKRGEWIYVTVEEGLRTGKRYGHHCSECDEINKSGPSNFCPNCGARMKGADDEHRG